MRAEELHDKLAEVEQLCYKLHGFHMAFTLHQAIHNEHLMFCACRGQLPGIMRAEEKLHKLCRMMRNMNNENSMHSVHTEDSCWA